MRLLSRRGNDPTQLALALLQERYGDFESLPELLLQPGPSHADDDSERHDEDWVRQDSTVLDCGMVFVGGWGEVREDSFVGLASSFRLHTLEHLCWQVLATHEATRHARAEGDVDRAMAAAMRLGEATRQLEMIEVTGRARARYLAEQQAPNTHKAKRLQQLLAMKAALAQGNNSRDAAQVAFDSLPRDSRPASPEALLKAWQRHKSEVLQ